ncbi:MAG TPA: hypothetical protein VMS31_17495, partial [Pyrinomonadaceae bacterium]|nr:hypothetical protein [Pyrinomonadaceae bacterium]
GGDGADDAEQTPATRSITEDPPADFASANRKHPVFVLVVGWGGAAALPSLTAALHAQLDRVPARSGSNTPMDKVDEFEAELEPLLELCKKVARRVTAFHQDIEVDELTYELFLHLWKQSERSEFEVDAARRRLISVAATLIKKHCRNQIRDLMAQEQLLILERWDDVFKLGQADTLLDGQVYVTADARQQQDHDIDPFRVLKIVAPEKRGVLDVISLDRKELADYIVPSTSLFAWKAHSYINHPRKLAGDVPVVKGKKTKKIKKDTKENGESMVYDKMVFRSTNTLTPKRYGRGKAHEQQLAPGGWITDGSPSVNGRWRFEFWQEDCDETLEPSAGPPRPSMKFVCDLVPRILGARGSHVLHWPDDSQDRGLWSGDRSRRVRRLSPSRMGHDDGQEYKPTDTHASSNGSGRAQVLTLTLPPLSTLAKTRERHAHGHGASERAKPEACLVTVDD